MTKLKIPRVDGWTDIGTLRGPRGPKKTHTFFSPQPSKSGSESMLAQRAAVGQLVELGHSVFHKFGRLQDEWVCILPVLIQVQHSRQ